MLPTVQSSRGPDEKPGPSSNARVAVVTGSTQGIGLAIAEELARRGHIVVINNRSGTGAETAVEKVVGGAQGVHRKVVYQRADVGDSSQLASLVSRVVSEFGRLDVWVNNASPPVKVDFFEHQTPDDHRAAMESKFFIAFQCIHAVLPVMKAQHAGSIINIVSDAGRVGTAGESLIAAAYGGLIAMSKSLAREFARYNVRINNVSVTLTKDTLAYDRVLGEPTGRKIFEKIGSKMQLGVLEPSDVAQAAGYFAESRRTTGQTLSVNSGLSFPS